MAIAIVLAAGVGSRMNSSTPKQFLMLKGKEVLYYSLSTFNANENIDHIILVTGKEHIEYCKSEIVDKYGFTKVTKVVEGGAERYNSVYNGLCACDDLKCEDGIVIIHDGARPFVTDKMIEDSVCCIKSGYSGCTVGVPAKDTIKIVKKVGENIVGDKTPDRRDLYLIQTPQTFARSKLLEAYNRMLEDEDHNITDDTMLMEQYIEEMCAIVPGAYENIKLTTPEDLLIGEIFVEK